MKKYLKNKKGFTLIELIVVIAILGILAAIIIPKLGGFQDRAKKAADEATAKTLADAVAMYNADNPDAKLGAGKIADMSGDIGDMCDTSVAFTSTEYAGSPYLAYDTDGAIEITSGTGDGSTVVYPQS